MTSPFEEQLQSALSTHRSRGILLDTNVLLLFLIAVFKPSLIGKKRLEKYDEPAGNLLVDYVGQFQRILTTPHVLAETSNLARQIVGGRLRQDLFSGLHPLFCLQESGSFKQIIVDGAAIDATIFQRIGLTDSGLTELVKNGEFLLTDDLDLYVASVTTGGIAINFTHMREAVGII
jgi:hypothetical protein